MALINCPECGNEISNRAPSCIFCGYPIQDLLPNDSKHDVEKKEKQQIKKKIENSIQTEHIAEMNLHKVSKTKKETLFSPKWILLLCSLMLILSTCIILQNKNKERRALAEQVITYYNSGKYEKALNAKADLDKESILEDYALKVTLMGKIQAYLNEEDNELYAVFYYLGNYKDFVNEGLDSIIYPTVVEAAQRIANRNIDLLYYVKNFANRGDKVYTNQGLAGDKHLSELLEPLLTEDKELLLEIAEKIDGTIDHELAKKEYELYINELKQKLREEQQKEYDSNHPVQINDSDITPKGNYWYCNGSVHNVSNSTHYYVKVKVTYMDKNKKVLTTDWAYAVNSEGIKGGENQQFEIMTKVQGDVQYYKVEIIEWK